MSYEQPRTGWVYRHEHDAQLIARDGLMCEAHIGCPWPHDDCPGPGMAWAIEGKDAIREALEQAYMDGFGRDKAWGKVRPWRTAWTRERTTKPK